MALFRAVESSRPDGERLFCDSYAAGFLSGGLRIAAAAARVPAITPVIEAMIDRRAPGPRVSALVRTRLIDQALREALDGTTRQVVLLGAGYDSRPYRVKGIAATRVFEVDHPNTQAVKRRRLRRMLASAPPNVVWVAVDFLTQKFGPALVRAGYDARLQTFFIWEGVTNYLTDAAVDATLRWIAAHSGPASRLSFTYVDRALLDGSRDFPGSAPWLERVRSAGEPFTFGLDPDQLAGYLHERGLRLISDVSTAQALEELDARAGRLAAPPGFYRVALAQVPAEQPGLR